MKLSNIKAMAMVAKNTIVKHSPEILMGLGAVSFVATIVSTAKNTVDAQDIIEDHKEEMEAIAVSYAMADLDEKAYKKSKLNVYVDTSTNLVINYIPSLAFGTVSLVSFFGAFGIMKKRYTTLVMAYTALEESFRRYRERVIADKGVDADTYYLTGAKAKEITVKDEKGNKTKQKQLVLEDGTIISSPYAFKFSKYKENGDRNNQWCNEISMLMAYTLGQQDYLNDQLYQRCVFDRNHNVKYRGSVMLNEIRDLLGEDPTPTGAVVGNRYSNGEPGCNGYIDFRITESLETDPDTGDKIPCLIINPNVDGMIYDLLGQKEAKPFLPTYGNEWGEE